MFCRSEEHQEKLNMLYEDLAKRFEIVCGERAKLAYTVAMLKAKLNENEKFSENQ